MTSVGATLRSVRERQGRAIAEIAEELCLTRGYLRAIEENDVKSLPGTFFYKSYVKQYAGILGVDLAQLASGIAALTAAEDAPLPAVVAPVPTPHRRYFSSRSLGGSVAGLVGVLFACSTFYAWWQKPASAVTIRPAVMRVPPTPPVQTTNIIEADPEPVNSVALNLSATEKTWLSITSDGKQIFSGILEASQTKILTGLDVARMKVGNAGGIEVEFNGKPIGPIGPRGQTRVVVFTPDDFKILPSDPPPPPGESL